MKDLIPDHRTTAGRTCLLMAGVLGSVLLLLWYFGELIPVGDGFGFGDGRTYGRLAMSFPEFRYVDGYRMARVLPSMVVNASHRLLPGPATVELTIRLFRLMNVAMLVGSVLVWCAVAKHLSLRRPAIWIGFIGLFVNFANLKLSIYYPALTDTAAFALGMLLVYAFLATNTRLVVAVTLAAAFTSPPLLAFALVLLILPRLDLESVPKQSLEPATRKGTVPAILLGVAAGWRLLHLGQSSSGQIVSGGEEVWSRTLWLSIGIVVVYLVSATRPLFQSMAAHGGQWLRRLSSRHRRALFIRVAGSAAFVVAAFAVYRLGVVVEARETDIVLDRMIYSSVARPFAFLLGHVAHFGPIIVLTMLLWAYGTRRAGGFGPGLVIVSLGIIVLGLNSESRTITAALPFVVTLTAVAADRLAWRAWHLWVFGLLSVVASRVWLPINQGAIDQLPILEFPAQFYFMNFAPWMSNTTYWWFMAGLALITASVVTLVVTAGRAAGYGYSRTG